MKRKVWVKRTANTWMLTKAQGFKPTVTSWSDEELDVFLRENDDVEPVLTY